MRKSPPASEGVVVGSYINKECEEVYIKNGLRFIDSLKFMASRRDKLVSYSNHDRLRQTKKVTNDKIYLVTRKGVYSYTTFQRIVLNDSDYHDHYLKTDVLLLTDVFEKFGNICLKNYELDPPGELHHPWIGLECCIEGDKS